MSSQRSRSLEQRSCSPRILAMHARAALNNDNNNNNDDSGNEAIYVTVSSNRGRSGRPPTNYLGGDPPPTDNAHSTPRSSCSGSSGMPPLFVNSPTPSTQFTNTLLEMQRRTVIQQAAEEVNAYKTNLLTEAIVFQQNVVTSILREFHCFFNKC